jgi:hypothetical protein
MAKLTAFDVLECEGEYQPPNGEARSVLVRCGRTTLTIATFDERPLAHWPVAGIARAAGPDGKIVLSPDLAGVERLVIDDGTMLAVLDDARSPPLAGPTRRRRRRLLRRLAPLALVAALAGVVPSVDWHGALAERLPREAVARLGRAAVRLGEGDALCRDPAAAGALARLVEALRGAGVEGLSGARVARGGGAPAAAAGAILVLPEAVIAEAGTAEALVAMVAEALVRHDRPLRAVLDAAGLAAIPPLSRGDLTAPVLVEAAAAVLAEHRAAPVPIAAPTPVTAPSTAGAGLGKADWQALREFCRG